MPSLELEENYQYLAWARAAGFTAIECEIAHPDDPSVRRIVQTGLDRHGMRISGIRTGISYALEGLCLSSSQPEIVAAATERLIAINRFCALHPGCLNLIGMMQGRIDSPEAYPGARSQIIKALKSICRSAEDLGVTVSLEAVNHLLINYHNTLASVAEIISEVNSPSLGLLADTFHMNIEEKSMTEPLLKYGSLINHFHVADSNRWAPGRGHIDFAAVFATLKQIGYTGWITVESDPKPDYATMARESYAALIELQSGQD
jgi:sugar phosphate isomerase/epimerase